MRILLDESIPHKLRLLIGTNHTVATAWFQGWSGLKNGAVLDVAEEAGFGLFIPADQQLNYQQIFRAAKLPSCVEHEQLGIHQGPRRFDCGG